MHINRQMGVLVLLINMWCLTESKFRRDRKKRAYKHLQYENCGDRVNNTIHVFEASAHPMPIPSPGKLRVTMGINVTRDLPSNIAIDLKLWKRLGFYGKYFRVWIPCIKGVGSCYYKEVCPYLSQYVTRGCPRGFRRRGLPCYCPFQAGVYTASKLTFRIPSLSGLLSYVAKGSYEAEVRLYDHMRDTELGCVKVLFSIRPRKRRRKPSKAPSARAVRHQHRHKRDRNYTRVNKRTTFW